MNLISYTIGLKVTEALNDELFQGEENGAEVVSSLKQLRLGFHEQRDQIYDESTEVDLEMDSSPLTSLCSQSSFFFWGSETKTKCSQALRQLKELLNSF